MIRPQEDVEIYKGSYGEYVSWRKQKEAKLAESQSANINGNSKAASYARKVRGMSPYQLKQRVAELEAEISDLEVQMDQLRSEIETASANGEASRVQLLGEQYTHIEQSLDAAIAEWSELAGFID